MGNRLSKITTRTGDDGTTGLADGTRLPKDDLRFDAMGSIDTLNAHIGLLQAYLDKDDTIYQQLSTIQHRLFNIGGEIALPNHASIGYIAISDNHLIALESDIDTHNHTLPYLKEFILPAGSLATCTAHLARCLCRDSERLLVRLSRRDNNISQNSLKYLNRLSDYLFIIARIIARRDNGSEVLWQKDTA